MKQLLLHLNVELLWIGVCLFAAPFFGAFFRDFSNEFEKGLRLGNKWKIWRVMTVYMGWICLLLRWLVPFTWYRLIALVLLAPLFGYLAMLGATKLYQWREKLFGRR